MPMSAEVTMKDEDDQLPEQLFLDFRISDVLDKSKRIPRAEPWASQYCTAILEKRYGDAIFARYHMDGRAVDGLHTSTRENSKGYCESYQVLVYDMIMEDAQGYAQGSPNLYRDALVLYSNTSPNDTHREIIEGLTRIRAGSNMVDRILSWARR